MRGSGYEAAVVAVLVWSGALTLITLRLVVSSAPRPSTAPALRGWLGSPEPVPDWATPPGKGVKVGPLDQLG
jgi:hypothetical protein